VVGWILVSEWKMEQNVNVYHNKFVYLQVMLFLLSWTRTVVHLNLHYTLDMQDGI